MQLSGSKLEGRAAWWWNDAFGARSTETCFIDSRRLGAPRAARKRSILICSYPSCQRHPLDQPDANRGVAVCLPRARYRSLVTAQTSNGDATDVWTRPIPSHPHLICGTGAEVASGSVLKTGADGQKCNLSQKRFGDFFCGVKGLRRFILSVAWG